MKKLSFKIEAKDLLQKDQLKSIYGGTSANQYWCNVGANCMVAEHCGTSPPNDPRVCTCDDFICVLYY